jgi:hypothetical protein
LTGFVTAVEIAQALVKRRAARKAGVERVVTRRLASGVSMLSTATRAGRTGAYRRQNHNRKNQNEEQSLFQGEPPNKIPYL